MVNVKAVAKRNPQKPDEAPQYYASAVRDELIDTDSFVKLITQNCSLGRPDVYALMVTISELIPKLLAEGKSVSLGDIGTFSVSVKSESAESAKKLKSKMIKGLNIVYRPSKLLKKKLAQAEINFIR